MDRSTRAALSMAGASVLAVLAITGKPAIAIGQALLLGLPLLLIAFPDAMEYGHRLTYQGMAHGGEPTPGVVLRVLGWIALIAFAIGGPAFKLAQLG